MFITLDNIRSIGDKVGSFIKSDLSVEKNRWRKAIRIRVTVDLRKPLIDSVILDLNPKPGIFIQVEIRFERLADFYYKCGILGHKFNSCNSAMANSSLEMESSSTLPFAIDSHPIAHSALWGHVNPCRALLGTPKTSSFLHEALNAKDSLHENLDCMVQELNSPIGDQADGAKTQLCLDGPALTNLISPPSWAYTLRPISNLTNQPILGPQINQIPSYGPSKYVIPSRRPPIKPDFPLKPDNNRSKCPLLELINYEPYKKNKQSSSPIVDLRDFMETSSSMEKPYELNYVFFPTHPSLLPILESDHLDDILHSVSITKSSDHTLFDNAEVEAKSIIITGKKMTKWKRLARSKYHFVRVDNVTNESGASPSLSLFSSGLEGLKE
ncbi:hypothetical protein BUALT_Bualt16G0034900 [Buddleja alternifolia]|uniref:Zinc knuckle CX2CX4HX4C domain-containing protein n=1 Tax=Buddleja alternifolia TaxID=168488 RepID=A0AAV6WJC7_9LAMI|nr:hypothetical protein BUALT_Bualt16G0034900 [Buddleja alternifolia]